MSKRYKNKPCAYCGTATSDTADHVLARDFFLNDDRQGIPKVAACRTCNSAKSVLEHYLTTVLPFGSDHPVAIRVAKERTEARLGKNQKLRRELAEGARDVLRGSRGALVPGMTLPYDGSRAAEYFAMVARGLRQHHSSAPLAPGYGCLATAMTKGAISQFELLQQMVGPAGTFGASLCSGALEYKGIVADGGQVSAWLIRLYGELALASSAKHAQIGFAYYAITHSPEFLKKIEAAKKAEGSEKDGAGEGPLHV